jgi:cystathionine beta-lyase/cystathionine gamma-synthase
MTKRRPDRIDTQLVHAGEPSPRIAGAVAMPIFQSSTYEYGGEGRYDDLRYLRLNNSPNHVALHDKLAALEGAEQALVTASGMAAISATLLSLLRPGDHVLAQRCLYGGTHDFLTGWLARQGVAHDFVDGDDPQAWAAAVRPTTRVFYVEAMTNPLLEVADLPGIAAFARDRGITSVIDATFASPLLYRPVAHGFHLVVHSATKFLNGHSDIVAGVVAGEAERVGAVRSLLSHLGGTLDAHACFLLHRGLKTLAVRLRHQCGSAQAIAEALVQHPKVRRVAYPGLPDHPHHTRARELFSGFGGMLSFEIFGDLESARAMLDRLRLVTNAPSLGGPESLATLPALTSHLGLAPEARRAIGIEDTLVRLSAGLEDPADIIADLQQALG